MFNGAIVTELTKTSSVVFMNGRRSLVVYLINKKQQSAVKKCIFQSSNIA